MCGGGSPTGAPAVLQLGQIPDALVAGNRNLDFGLATEVHIISNNFIEEGKTGFETR